ncbi:11107_t:CDS:2, partial [Dentiscutata erythropus]
SMIDTKDEIMAEIRLAIREVTALVSSQKNDKAFHLQEECELNEGFGEPTHVAGQTQDVIAPFVPLFSIVMNIHDQMLSIYENATCNEKICSALLDRVEFVHTKIKKFAKVAAQMTSFRKFMSAKAVKDACEKLSKNLKGFLSL